MCSRGSLTGNPLSLVPDADGLEETQMRAIAREFNQSETTFLLRPNLAGAAWRLRSFTPTGAEVGGAGHNALGAWLGLEAAGRLDGMASELAQAALLQHRGLGGGIGVRARTSLGRRDQRTRAEGGRRLSDPHRGRPGVGAACRPPPGVCLRPD